MYVWNYKQQTQVGIKAILHKINSLFKKNKKKIKIIKHEQQKACKGKRQRDTLCKKFLFFSNDIFAIIQNGNSNRINVAHTTIMNKECNTQENFSLHPLSSSYTYFIYVAHCVSILMLRERLYLIINDKKFKTMSHMHENVFNVFFCVARLFIIHP